MAAAVAVDGEEPSPDGEEPSPDRHHTTRNDDACAQSKTVLQVQAGSGHRGEDKKRAKAAADDDDAGATPLQAPSPGWSGKLAVAGPREATPRPLVAVKLFPQAKPGQVTRLSRLSLASGRPLAAVLQPSLSRFASLRSPARSLLINWMKT